MFNWMVKVVPQVPDGTPTAGEQGHTAADGKSAVNRGKLMSAKSIREDDQGSETSQGSVQSGVLNWLSNGFVSALPQPAGSPLLHRANSEAKSPQEEGSDRPGVIGWISQGIVKVVPQPEAKYAQKIDEPDETTEIHNFEELPDAEPLPHIPVVEMVSEDEASAEEPSAQFQPKVVEWIKTGFQNALPHHVPRPPDYPDNSSQRSSCSSNKVLSPPPESVTSLTEVDTNVSVMGWIVHGLGLALPQPVLRGKEDHGKVTEVIQNAIHVRPAPVDPVLEEIGPEEVVPLQEKRSEHQSSGSEHSQVLQTSIPAEVVEQSKPEPESSLYLHQSAPASCTQHEDAETQTGRWTPFIESIRKEAENDAIATMEERLRQERLEMVRMAEEVARQTAEIAVRELTKARLAIHTTIAEVAEEAEPEPEPELQVLQDEESEMEISPRSKPSECDELSAVEEFVQEVEELAIVENVIETASDPETAEEEQHKDSLKRAEKLEEEVGDLRRPEEIEQLSYSKSDANDLEKIKEDQVQATDDPETKEEDLEEVEQSKEAERYTEKPQGEEPRLPSPPSEPEPASPEPVRAVASPAGQSEESEEGESDDSSEAESEPDAVTEQPKSAVDAAVSHCDAQVEEVLTEEGTEVRSRCDALKACLMHIPYTSVCLDRFSQLLKDKEVPLPKVPPLLKLPPQLSQVTQHLSSLPIRLNQLPQHLASIPQQISECAPKCPQQFPSFPKNLPSFPKQFPCSLPQRLTNIQESLSNISERASNIPQQIAKIPQQISNIPQYLPQPLSSFSHCAQQCYATVQNRLNSLRPVQDA